MNNLEDGWYTVTNAYINPVGTATDQANKTGSTSTHYVQL